MFRHAVLLLCLAGFSRAQNTGRMDQVAQSYVASKQFMGAVLVARGNQVLFNKAYGSADLEWEIANTPETKFRLGSLTKQFTAASILLLEERGKLKTSDRVKQYLPDAPPAWDRITIFHLLTHTSGIPNFTSFPEYPKMESFRTSPEAIVAMIRDRPLDFQPGEKWNYSNSGYVLLGYLIEKITGASYEKFLAENIFTPLEMKDSGYDSNSAILMRRASGYTPGPHGIEHAGFINMTVPHAAGALYSTTGDLLRWEQGLFGGKLLSAASLQKMTTPFLNDYACGLVIHTVQGHRVIEHSGGIEGFNTHLAYLPDDQVTVIVLANLNGAAPDLMGAQLATIALAGNVILTSERKEIKVPASTLAKYAGTYHFAQGPDMVITLAGDQLYTKLGAQPKIPIFAESETKFFVKVVDAQVDFSDSGLTLHQAGRDSPAARQ